MGDMIRCPKCRTFHYRNDPCPYEYAADDAAYESLRESEERLNSELAKVNEHWENA